MAFAVLAADHRVKLKENKKRYKYLDLARELKNVWNIKVTVIPIVIGARYSHQRIDTETGGLGNIRTSGDYSIVEYKEESWRLEETCCHTDPSENHRLV